jgi:hypothetical protein
VPSAYATPAGTACGTTRTVANTPVIIKVTKGTVPCSTALAVEEDYTAAFKRDLAKGLIKGNGGGPPLTVDGWTCQAYPTPQILRTGVTSDCHTASAALAAVLDLAAPAPTPGG